MVAPVLFIAGELLRAYDELRSIALQIRMCRVVDMWCVLLLSHEKHIAKKAR
jgi:hypothetical protein